MDLFATPQSIAMVAILAAGCMVAGGWIARGRDRWRLRFRRMGLEGPPSSDHGLTPVPGQAIQGPRVMVVGRLKVDGAGCARFEDGAPVAVTHFEGPSVSRRPQPLHNVTRSMRAKDLWVDVGGERVTVQGPVRVHIGSEEHYPASPVDERKTRERIEAAPAVPSGHKERPPRHGVFRSVKPDDQVVVVGRIEHDPAAEAGARWHVRPDASGAVSIYYRRRPTVRGAFFKLQGWAAAMLAG